jgi:hypothetical protein
MPGSFLVPITTQGIFPCGRSLNGNMRSQKEGGIHMSEVQKQKAMEYIAKKKTGTRFLLGGPGFLQTFADGENGDDDLDDDQGDDDDDQGDDDDKDDLDDQDNDIDYTPGQIDEYVKAGKLTFDQLLKDNPALKKQYTARFNKNMSKRLGKFEGVDVDEYNDLKKRASEGKLEGDAKTWKDKHDALQSEITSMGQKQ